MCATEGQRAVVATLVATDGATFRRPGARMLVTEGGARFGSISAGCVESDIAERAAAVFATGEPRLVSIRTGDDGEVYFGTGTGCDGELGVLLELAVSDGELAPDYSCLARAIDAAAGTTITTVVGRGPGGRVGCARYFGDANTGSRAAIEALEEPITLVERLEQPRRLILCGAGPVAEELGAFALRLGWEAVGVDRRRIFGSLEAFPGCVSAHCMPYGEVSERVVCDGAAAVLLTHNLLDDVALLKSFLKSNVGSISIVSSRARVDRLFATLTEDGFDVADADRERIFAPAGLDIGSETPAEIALAIMAELQAMCTGRSGRSLRELSTPIHGEVPA